MTSTLKIKRKKYKEILLKIKNNEDIKKDNSPISILIKNAIITKANIKNNLAIIDKEVNNPTLLKASLFTRILLLPNINRENACHLCKFNPDEIISNESTLKNISSNIKLGNFSFTASKYFVVNEQGDSLLGHTDSPHN